MLCSSAFELVVLKDKKWSPNCTQAIISMRDWAKGQLDHNS